MKRLTLHERDRVEIGPDACLTDAEADDLGQLERHGLLPGNTLTWGRRELRFGPYCGVIRTQRVTIELLPKIERDAPDSEGETRGLLVAMLAKVGQLNIRRAGTADLGRQDSHLLDIFIEDFCDRVKTALRGGAISRYIENRENLTAVRGRLELTEHLRTNAFDRSRLFCRFDERSIDNPYNQSLKAVLRLLHGLALGAGTRATAASLLHRFDDVAERRVESREVKALRFDRTIGHWQPVFERAAWLLDRLFPDVRTGDAAGSALLFDMERLFETVFGLHVRRESRTIPGRHLSVELQGPRKNLAWSAFRLRPDITIREGDEVMAILDTKWKRLETDEANAGVTSADAYQMNAYAGRYGCDRLALVYPATNDHGPGLVTNFLLRTEGQPVLKVVAVDIRELAFGDGPAIDLEEIVPTGHRHP